MAGLGGAAADTPVGVVGAGTMGTGIAEVAALAGHPVRLLDAVPGAAERARERVLERLARGDDDTLAGPLAPTGRVTAVDAVDGLAGCAVVVESVVEDRAAKQAVLAAVEPLLAPGGLLATNTSSLSVTALAAGLADPRRAVGLHFFNPARQMRLVEVVRGEETAPEVVEAACELARSWGKAPVVAASTPGFIVNRVARPFYGEAQRLVEEGVADPSTLDALLREAGGFPMGPFELADLVGQDVNLAVSRSVWEQTFADPRYAPTVLQQRLVDAGRLGRKTGRGVYRYSGGAAVDASPATEPPREPPATLDVVLWEEDEDAFPVMQPFLDRCAAGGVRLRTVVADPDADELVSRGVQLPGGGVLVEVDHGDWSGLGGTVELDWAHDPAGCRRVALLASADCPAESVEVAVGLCQAGGAAVSVLPASVGGVVARTVAMLVNEAVELVTRGEATAEDVDVAMVLGTGYPSGPLGWGDAVGADRVTSLLQQLADTRPSGRYRPGPALGRSLVAGTHLRDL